MCRRFPVSFCAGVDFFCNLSFELQASAQSFAQCGQHHDAVPGLHGTAGIDEERTKKYD